MGDKNLIPHGLSGSWGKKKAHREIPHKTQRRWDVFTAFSSWADRGMPSEPHMTSCMNSFELNVLHPISVFLWRLQFIIWHTVIACPITSQNTYGRSLSSPPSSCAWLTYLSGLQPIALYSQRTWASFSTHQPCWNWLLNLNNNIGFFCNHF